LKRAVSGKGRSGTPPLPRQRKALRVTQITLAGLGAIAVKLAFSSWRYHAPAGGSSRMGAAVFLTIGALACLGAALWMGIRTVRGPQPPSL
jgi:hypothetical protein